MTWNVSAECISAVIVCIILVYSKNSNLLPTLKNKMFQFCLAFTLAAICSNILSTVMLYNYIVFPIGLTWIVTAIYFVLTPFMGSIYFFYSVAVVYEGEKNIKQILFWGSIPYVLYFIFVMANFYTKVLFDIHPLMGYQRGPALGLTYIVFYAYCFMSQAVVFLRRKFVEPCIRKILLSFSIIALIVVFIQQLVPDCLLTGSAACCALLIIYLYLQNKQISIDYLTGLLNRQEFLKMLQLRTKERKIPFQIIVMSLNDFKFINDKFGQQNGDLFLQKISEFLKVVMSLPLLYRYNGDQFAICVEDKGGAAHCLLEKLIHRFDAPWEVNDYNYVISASFGVVSFPDTADDMGGIINALEYAIFCAKKKKGVNYCYCTPDMLEQVKRKHEVVMILKESLQNGDFEVFLQPIYSVEKKCFTLAESLLRLNKTTLGIIRPDEFIPIAEETGLITDITYWVLDYVCKIIKRWTDEEREFSGISVNLSSVQFLEENLENKIMDIILRNDVDCTKLKFEITEGVLVSNFKLVKSFILRMNQHGIRFGLDDFGTGYSNLTSVLQIPLDIVKLDKSLIWASMEDESSATLVRHVSSAFSELGMKVLAEGVETQEQNEFACDCGCSYIQGYLYAKPMPEGEASAHYAVKNNKGGL